MIWIWLIVPAMILAWWIMTFLINFFEKHNIKSYIDWVISTDEISKCKYIETVIESAKQHGFSEWSYFLNCRFKIISAFSFSPKRDIFIHTGEGTIVKVPIKQTWLISRLADGSVISTTNLADNSGLADIVKVKVVWEASFDKLFQEHLARLEGLHIISFDGAGGPDTMAMLEKCKADYLYDRGMIEWVDPARSKWKMTFKGALHSTIHTRRQQKEVVDDVKLAKQKQEV